MSDVAARDLVPALRELMPETAVRELMHDVTIRELMLERELMLDVDIGESVLVGELVYKVAQRAGIAVIEYGIDAPNSLEETNEVVSQCMVTL